MGWFDPTQPLDRAWLALTAGVKGAVDEIGVLTALDVLAARVVPATPEQVARVLFDEEGFAGDDEAYDDPANSFVDDVVNRRRGLPIALAALAVEVGRRSGVAMHGVGMPGHFLVGTADGRLLDPFHNTWLDESGARRLHARIHGPGGWDASHLAPVGTLAIVERMLANLQGSYQRRGQRFHLARVLRLRAELPGADPAFAAAATRMEAVFN